MDMVERVAKAIETAGAIFTLDSDGTVASIFDYITDDDIQILARAAIEAMREPTMDMAATAANWQGGQMTYSDVWRVMIDAALKKA